MGPPGGWFGPGMSWREAGGDGGDRALLLRAVTGGRTSNNDPDWNLGGELSAV